MTTPLDVSDMKAVHGVFRDALAAAPTLVSSAAAGQQRAELIGNFYQNILAFLAVHHQGEDELMFPLLRERCPDRVELVDQVAAQHLDVHELVEASTAALAEWPTSDTDPGSALAALGERMAEHLDQEEELILPLCAAQLSPAEWGALPSHGIRQFEGDKIWLILGLIRERMTQEQRDAMLTAMPPPAVEMWTGFGQAAFDQLMTQVGAPLG